MRWQALFYVKLFYMAIVKKISIIKLFPNLIIIGFLLKWGLKYSFN